MDKDTQHLREYMSNLRVNVITAAYTHCWDTWRDIDYTPDYNKIYFICDGEGWLKIGDEEFYPKSGQLFLMPAGVKQSYSVISTNTFKKFWCHFTAKIGDMNLFDVVKTSFHIDVPSPKEIEAMFRELLSNHEGSGIACQVREKGIILEIIAYYIENCVIRKTSVSGTSSFDKLNQVIEYINNNLYSDMTVEQLAGIIHFHPNYFIKFFKRYTGTSPIQYINRTRLEKSKYLLKSSKMNVTEIAYLVGFNDIYHFSKTFKSYTGFSPSDYRNI